MRPDWADDVKRGINLFLDAYTGEPEDYAVFDFDNTLSVFDTEDQMLFYQLEHLLFAIPPDELEEILTKDVGIPGEDFAALVSDTGQAYRVLRDRYGTPTADGMSPEQMALVRKDPYYEEFRVKFLCVFRQVYRDLAAEAADRWMLRCYYGMRPEEIRQIAGRMIEAYRGKDTEIYQLESPAGIDSAAGQRTVVFTRGYCVTENMRELTAVLHNNGVDVWICSASDVDAVRASADAFGMHGSIRGILGMTPELDQEGRCGIGYDLTGAGYYSIPGGWEKMARPINAVTCEAGKPEAVQNAIAPDYAGRGPALCVMDSEGDYALATAFDTVRLLLCINRADRQPDDGGSIMARAALFQKERNENVPARRRTIYLLQGRNEQGKRSFWNSEKTLLPGETEPLLFKDKRNLELLERAVREAKNVREITARKKQTGT